MTGIILASASRARARMLEASGVTVACVPANLDEAEIKDACRQEAMDVVDTARTLAGMKAAKVSHAHPGILVVGADQMLECEGRWFDKPIDRDDARRHLWSLRGRAHRLVSAVAVCRDGEVLKTWSDEARLTMRPFSESFLDTYLERAGPDVLNAVGVYQIEGVGVQLFSAIDGDHFTILGMPLLAVLDYLRGQGVIQS